MRLNFDSHSLQEMVTVGFLAKQHKIIQMTVCFFLAVIVLAGVSFGAFKYFNITQKFESQKRKEAADLVELGKRLEFKNLADRYAEEIAEVNATLAQVRRQLPESLNASDFIEQLNMNAMRTGIEVRSSSPLGEQSKGFYTKFPVQIEGCATYDQIGQFVANLSELERIITLDNFSLSSPLSSNVLPNGLMTAPNISGVSSARASCEGTGKQPFSALIATYKYNSR